MSSVIEVGSWKGRSTTALLSGCPGPVFAVDHWLGSNAERTLYHSEAVGNDVYAEFITNVGSFPNLVPVRMQSIQAAASLDNADMVFIDGGHEYEEVKADVSAWRGRARKVLCGHDYNWKSVRRAVDEILGPVVQNPIGNIWLVSNDPSFAIEAAQAPVLSGDPTNGFAHNCRTAIEDVLLKLQNGWMLMPPSDSSDSSAIIDPHGDSC